MTPTFQAENTGGSTSTHPVENSLEGLRAFPNPCQDLLHVEGFACGTELQIYNLHGQVLLRQQGESSLDLSGLGAGIYLLRAGDQSIRIIKQ